MSVLLESHPYLSYEYRTAPDPAAETIMLLHGNGFNSIHWGEMADLLGERFHLLLIDVQGGPLAPTWDQLCTGLQVVVEALRIKRLHIAGHSFGASWAVAFADRYPDSVKTLILISIVVFYPKPEGEQLLHSYLSLIEQEGLKAVARRELLPFLTLDREGEKFQAIRHAYDEMDEASYLRLFKLQMRERPIDGSLKLACPTLLLAGEGDELYLPTLQAITAGYFQQGTFLIVPQAANAVFIDQPQLTAQWMLDFIRKASGPASPPRMKSSLSGHLPSVLRSAVHAGPPSEAEKRPVLKISLFHGFQVTLNGVPIAEGWDKRYAKNITAYLAMHASCTREELCDALFPELTRLTALSNLRVYLGHLKKLLEIPGEEPILRTSRKHIRLEAAIDCDLQTYSAALKRIVFIEDGEEKYAAAKAFLSELGDSRFMTGLYDQWFVDYRYDIEELIAGLSQWAAAWEAGMNRPDAALYFDKIADRILDNSM